MNSSEAQAPTAAQKDIALTLDADLDLSPASADRLDQNNQPTTAEVTALELRPVWLEVLFNICTLGLYTCVWFYKRTKEFNQTENTQFKPVLWLFMPLIVLAELFALPKFIGAIKQMEARAGLPQWHSRSGWWMFAIVLLTLLSNLANKVEFPSGCLTLLILLWAIAMSAPSERIYRARAALAPPGAKIFYKLKWQDWLVLVLGSLVFIFIAAIDLKNLYTNPGKKLTNNSRYIDKERGFSLPILGEGWHQVEVGTNSDGTALLEFQGPLDSMYFLVFEDGNSETPASVSESRLDLILDSDEDANCELSHHLDHSGTQPVARIHCNSRYFGDPATYESTSIHTKTGVYELYGFLSSSRLSYQQEVNNFSNMAKEFRAE